MKLLGALIGLVVLLVLLFWPVSYEYGEPKKVFVSPGRSAVIEIVDRVADKILTHVDVPLDLELPVTLANYPSSPQTAAVIGGRGYGLQCSIPSYAKYVFRPGPGYAPIAFRFRQACSFHDMCYSHGLATYGYVQNDCDELLQEHAFQICRYIFRKTELIDYCRKEAKKITLAVRLRGFDQYQNWGDSTFFEFDPFPVHSRRFLVARLVKPHQSSGNKQPLDLVGFDVRRARIATTCLNCPNTPASKVVPLEPEGVYSAPQLVADADGGSRIAFATRLSATNTATLFAHGRWSDQKQIELAPIGKGGTPDLLGSTTYVLAASRSANPTAGIIFMTPTVQCFKDGRPSFAAWRSEPGEPFASSCGAIAVQDTSLLVSDRYRLFQHPVLVDRDGRFTVLVRRGDDGVGSGYDKQANMIVISTEAGLPQKSYQGAVVKGVPAAEIHEPLVLLPGHAKEGPVLVSLVGAPKHFSIVETALETAAGTVRAGEARVVIEAQPADLARDWIDRSALLLDLGEGPSLVLTRTSIATESCTGGPRADKGAEVNRVCLDVLQLRRTKGESGTATWEDVAASRCDVRYTIKQPDPQNACLLSYVPGSRLPVAVNRLRSSQTLSGDYRGEGGTDVVVMDPCLLNTPIVLESAPDTKGSWQMSRISQGDQSAAAKLIRNIDCRRITRDELVAEIKAIP